MDIINSIPILSLTIKEERQKLGLKQTEFASILGIGLKTLRKIEQGDLNINFIKLNYILNCLGLCLRPSELISSPVIKKKKDFSKENILCTLKRIFPIFKIKYGITELSLFGSYAKNLQNKNSDIDILIDAKDELSFEIEGEIQIILENLFAGKKIDLTFKKNIIEQFKNDIEMSKINVQ